MKMLLCHFKKISMESVNLSQPRATGFLLACLAAANKKRNMTEQVMSQISMDGVPRPKIQIWRRIFEDPDFG